MSNPSAAPKTASRTPLVSVIMPSFNSADTIEASLRSVVAQTYPALEIIVVDDGSRDDTVTRARAVPCERPILVEAEGRNQGAPRARNRGAELAKGEFLAFLDSDDSWSPDKIERQVQAMLAAPEAVLCYTQIRHDDHLGRVIYTSEYTRSGALGAELLTRNVVGSTSSVMIRRDAFFGVGGFDPGFTACQDWDLWVRLAEAGPFACCAAPLTQLLHHRGTRISNNGQRRLKGYLQFYRRHLRPLHRGGRIDLTPFRNAFADVLLQAGRRRAARRFYLGGWRGGRGSPRALFLVGLTLAGCSYGRMRQINQGLDQVRGRVRAMRGM
ncbi:glycosyltransferase family A protein [Phenylobacterium sp. LjRoot225]|uniref:glycosyltransferase family 2 protein n=1 Tax=Phenylobacterium sp. LjRoot225 TaxID=3342285 RepID=UPI003ED021AD